MKILLIIGAVFLYLIIGIILSYVFEGNVNSEFKTTDDDLNSMYVLLWPVVSVMTFILILIFIVVESINKIFKTNINL